MPAQHYRERVRPFFSGSRHPLALLTYAAVAAVTFDLSTTTTEWVVADGVITDEYMGGYGGTKPIFKVAVEGASITDIVLPQQTLKYNPGDTVQVRYQHLHSLIWGDRIGPYGQVLSR